MGVYREIVDSERAAAAAFGRMILIWRNQNHLSQKDLALWAHEANYVCYSKATASQIETGKSRYPREHMFLTLHEMNRCIAAKEFPGVRTRWLLDKLKAADKPMRDGDGRLMEFRDLIECHVGVRATPEAYQVVIHPMPHLDEERIAEMSQEWSMKGRVMTKASGKRPLAALEDASEFVPDELRERWEEVLTGHGGYREEELPDLWDSLAGEWMPDQWLRQWKESIADESLDLGGGARNLEQDSLNQIALTYPRR